jgi:uncharacterized membrane protein YfcA
MIIAPTMAFIAPDLIPSALIALMIPLNFWVAWRERDALNAVDLGWVMSGRVVGTALGFAILAALSSPALDAFVGLSTVAAALASWLAPKFRPGRTALAAAGLVTGITETATGIGGPPLALVYQHHMPAELRANIAATFFLGEVLSIVLLAASGRMTWTQLGSAAMLLPALAAGGAAGGILRRSLNQSRLRACVLIFSIVSGLGLMLRY